MRGVSLMFLGRCLTLIRQIDQLNNTRRPVQIKHLGIVLLKDLRKT